MIRIVVSPPRREHYRRERSERCETVARQLNRAANDVFGQQAEHGGNSGISGSTPLTDEASDARRYANLAHKMSVRPGGLASREYLETPRKIGKSAARKKTSRNAEAFREGR
jgi:hypothetical protein